jgi:hypothetical protein
VAIAARLHHALVVDANAVVKDADDQGLGAIGHLDFDRVRTRVTSRVRQRLATDAIDLVANQRMHRHGLALDDDPESRPVANTEFVRRGGQRILQVVDAASRRAQAADGMPPIFDDPIEQFPNEGQFVSRGQLFRYVRRRHMQMHRRADDALQQRVVQFLGNPRPLAKAFVKAQVQLTFELHQPDPVATPDETTNECEEAEPEPCGLPERRKHREGQRSFWRRPLPTAVEGDNVKRVRTRAKVGVDRGSLARWLAPMWIEAVETISIADALGHGQTDGGECNGDSPRTGRKRERRPRLMLDVVRGHAGDMQERCLVIAREP